MLPSILEFLFMAWLLKQRAFQHLHPSKNCHILRRYWGLKRVIDALTGESDLKLLNLGPCFEDWQNARRAQSSELTGRMQIM
jgi:hypothetical protein